MPPFLRAEAELFFGALRFFTRLPTPAWAGHSADKLNRASRYFPAAGLIVGVIGAAVWYGAQLFWPHDVAVLLALAATVWTTGAFHEDGLTDMVDGFGGGQDKIRILEIMKDSRIGAFGMIAFVFVLLGRFLALAALPASLVAPALIAGHAASRFFAVALLRFMDYVREDALAKAKPIATRIGGRDLCIAGLTALAPGFFLPPARFFCALLLAAGAAFWLARLYRRRLGGYTGDCLGAAQQAAELAFYLGALAHWPQGA
ncbi:MAG: adenosylcobinamide-GDP ribazoletransferase [Azoarcus sp.]|jgi:adenosylcobinamide-GDP ribazoletransferase|nr:adenosylcobinamide-GDP ribazoletransferase [Azoarcus sp.]